MQLWEEGKAGVLPAGLLFRVRWGKLSMSFKQHLNLLERFQNTNSWVPPSVCPRILGRRGHHSGGSSLARPMLSLNHWSTARRGRGLD